MALQPRPRPQQKPLGAGGSRAALLPGGRLHLQHGPIDLIAGAQAEPEHVRLAYAQARACFSGVLEGLVPQLTVLKTPLGTERPTVSGAVARRMIEAAWPFRETFVTPMAAVAGAVADTVLAAMTAGRGLDRAYVNNGGDIALHLTGNARYTAGIVERVDAPEIAGTLDFGADSPVRGLATSGWRGRSWSLGIADAVTVLARTAAEADVAATLIANAVNVEHPAIVRAPASEVFEEGDLGDRPVTVEAGALPLAAVAEALAAGVAEAETFLAHGLIIGALLCLAGQRREVGGTGNFQPAAKPSAVGRAGTG